MYRIEQKKTKFCMCGFFTLSAVAYFVCGLLSLERATNAARINKDFDGSPMLLRPVIAERVDSLAEVYAAYANPAITKVTMTSAYDSCSIPEFIRDPELTDEKRLALVNGGIDTCGDDIGCNERGTNWTIVWTWNAAWLLIMAVNLIVMAIGAFWWYPRLVGCFANSCFAICHLVALAGLFAARWSPGGRHCSYNLSTSTYDSGGNNSGAINEHDWFDQPTYQDDASLMLALSVI